MYGVIATICLTVVTVVPVYVQTVSMASPGEKRDAASSWGGWSALIPSVQNSWTVDRRIPMTAEADRSVSNFGRIDLEDLIGESRGKNKYYKKYKKYMLPLLLAYKLKFFTLIPVLIGGLVLLTGATGLAGFFFALFAATMGLKGGGGDH